MAISTDSAIVDVNVRYRVTGLDESARTAKRAGDQFQQFGRILQRVGLSLIAFKVIDGIISSLQRLGREMIEINSLFELAEVQLTVFTGSAVRAGQLLDFLTFQSTKLAGGVADLIAGATALETFGLEVERFLPLVADTASAINRSVQDVAIAFGRIAIGDPRTKQFLTTRRGDLVAFNEALKSTPDRLAALETAFSRFEGVSAAMEGTFGRLVENLGDMLTIVVKIASEPAFKTLEDILSRLVAAMRGELFTSGGGINKQSGMVRAITPGAGITGNLRKGSVGGFFARLIAGDQSVDEFVSGSDVDIRAQDLERFLEQDRQFLKRLEKLQIQATRALQGRGGVTKLNKFVAGVDMGQRALQGELERSAFEAKLIEDMAAFRLQQELLTVQERFNFERELRKKSQMEEDADANTRIRRRVLDMERSIANKSMISDRAGGILGFALFGGNGADVDRQIAAIQKEIDVLDGITTPLTRQEALLNSIVSLEAQRVTLIDRLGISFKNLAGDIASAAAKAAILFAISNVGERSAGGGLFGMFRTALGIASFIPGPHQPITAGASMGIGLNTGGPIGGDFTFGGASGKPTVINVINNSVILDTAELANTSRDIRDRRVR